MTSPLRMTHQREIILEELKQCHDHPTADELYERVRKRLPRISLATVYRNLEVLANAGLIRKLAVSGRQKRFDWNLEVHSHIFCIQCRRVDNIKQESSEEIPLLPKDGKGYTVTGCRVEYFGLCPRCNTKNETK